MYYKLKDINLNRVSRGNSDFIILSEVVDSGISYESPRIIKTAEELEIWFGKSFSSHDYLIRQLNLGRCLYLYRPISIPNEDIFSSFSNIVTFPLTLPLVELPKDPEVEKIYKLTTGAMWIWLVPEKRWQPVYSTKEYIRRVYDKSTKKYKDVLIDISHYTLVTKVSIQEKINNINQIEKYTKEFERIRKIYTLENGDKYTWFGWFNIKDLYKISDFKEKDYPKTETVNSLSEVKNIDKECIYITPSGKFIYYGDSSWLNMKAVPGVLENTSRSLENRDTIVISNISEDKVSFSYPKYSVSKRGLVYENSYEIPESFSIILENINTENIILGKSSFVFDLTQEKALGSSGYFVFPMYEGVLRNHLFYKCSKGEKSNYLEMLKTRVPPGFIPGAGTTYKDGYVHYITSISDILKVFSDNQYYSVVGTRVFSSYLTPNIDINELTGLNISGNVNISLSLINEKIEPTKGVEIWSRTIGKDTDKYNPEQYITVTIEEGTLDGYYRFIISKYGYTEVFEGPISFKATNEYRLEYKINKGSKLIRCNILDETELRTGTYTLYGASSEEYTGKNFRYGLERMFSLQEITVYPDFILFPDISLYDPELTKLCYFDIYDDIYNITKEYHCQALIQNLITGYIIKEVKELPEKGEEGVLYYIDEYYYEYINNKFIKIDDTIKILSANAGGDFVFNLVDDENKLVYFMSEQIINTIEYPGYYVFLEEILGGSYLNKVSDSILYYNFSSNPYDNSSELEVRLEKYKSNYLTYNHHYYYYERYLNGDKYKVSILKQFITGKIYREILKNRGSLIASKSISGTRLKLNSILDQIKQSYNSAISFLVLEDFITDLSKNKLSIYIKASLKELIEEDVYLSITVNYNEYGNSN